MLQQLETWILWESAGQSSCWCFILLPYASCTQTSHLWTSASLQPPDALMSRPLTASLCSLPADSRWCSCPSGQRWLAGTLIATTSLWIIDARLAKWSDEILRGREHATLVYFWRVHDQETNCRRKRNRRIVSVQQARVVYAWLEAVRLARLSRARNPCWKTLLCLYLGKVQCRPHLLPHLSLTNSF